MVDSTELKAQNLTSGHSSNISLNMTWQILNSINLYVAICIKKKKGKEYLNICILYIRALLYVEGAVKFLKPS